MKISPATAEGTKNIILDRAFARFGRYGFGKTTMAEIAQDCDMSPGNLYRYFKSKKDIGADCSRRCMNQKLELVREIVRNHKLDPARKLQALALEVLEYMHFQFSDQPALMELVDYISKDRWDIVMKYLEQERSLISEILAEGNRSGVFNVIDVSETAQFIQSGLIKFLAPRYMDAFPLETLRIEAHGTTQLLIEGIRAK